MAAPYNRIIEEDVMDCNNVFPCTSPQQNVNNSPFERFWVNDSEWSEDVIPRLCYDVLVNGESSFQILKVANSEDPKAICHKFEIANEQDLW